VQAWSVYQILTRLAAAHAKDFMVRRARTTLIATLVHALQEAALKLLEGRAVTLLWTERRNALVQVLVTNMALNPAITVFA